VIQTVRLSFVRQQQTLRNSRHLLHRFELSIQDVNDPVETSLRLVFAQRPRPLQKVYRPSGRARGIRHQERIPCCPSRPFNGLAPQPFTSPSPCGYPSLNIRCSAVDLRGFRVTKSCTMYGGRCAGVWPNAVCLTQAAHQEKRKRHVLSMRSPQDALIPHRELSDPRLRLCVCLSRDPVFRAARDDNPGFRNAL
jgi:hypothetical protein